jgi:adenosylcobinamide kinase / adenosylcobinamide-phosphate guanylyltransferase
MTAPGFALIGGGARSGKTSFALRLAMRRGPRRVFIATAEWLDDEMRERIRLHRTERGDQFTTLETPRDLDDCVRRLARETPLPDVVVVDCLTLWLSNLLLAGMAQPEIEGRVADLVSSLAAAPFRSLVVTNEVGMGVVPESALGRAFRDICGRAHQLLASVAAEIYLAAMGTMLRLRPPPVALVEEGSDA